MTKVTGANFFDKLREYVNHEDTADEHARSIVNLYDKVDKFHNPDGDDTSDDSNDSNVTVETNKDNK